MAIRSALVLALALLPAADAFAPAGQRAVVRTVRFETEGETEVEAAAEAPAPAPATAVPKTDSRGWTTVNGWTPDSRAFAYGLPGSLDPVKNFDPFGFADGASLEEMKMYREAEVTHGRVSMLAVLGFIVQEKVHFAFVDPATDIGPAIRHLDEVRAVNPWFFEVLTFAIALAEARRSTVGWKSPLKPGLTTKLEPGFGTKYTPGSLQDGYYPGDIGFDPLGLKPAGAADFAEMQTKELQNGRLAMLAIAGAVAQELVDGQPLFSGGLSGGSASAPDAFAVFS